VTIGHVATGSCSRTREQLSTPCGWSTGEAHLHRHFEQANSGKQPTGVTTARRIRVDFAVDDTHGSIVALLTRQRVCGRCGTPTRTQRIGDLPVALNGARASIGRESMRRVGCELDPRASLARCSTHHACDSAACHGQPGRGTAGRHFSASVLRTEALLSGLQGNFHFSTSHARPNVGGLRKYRV
jgi:hypothetical protein